MENLIGQKSSSKQLINNALICLKNTKNNGIIIRVGEIKAIRVIFEKNDEEILFGKDFIAGTNVFKDPSLFEQCRHYIIKMLGLPENVFSTKIVDCVRIEDNDDKLRIKLAFFYFKSVENLKYITDYIFQQIRELEAALDNESLYILIKIHLNLIKNLLYEENSENLNELKQRLPELLDGFNINEIFSILDLNANEVKLITQLQNGEQDDPHFDN